MRDKPDQQIIIPSRDNFKIEKFTQQDIENYIRNYTQYHQAMPRGR